MSTSVFTAAHEIGLTDGFVGTYAELCDLVAEEYAFAAAAEAELAHERYLESGWPGAERYRAEEEADLARNPFDPQTGALAA